jgi:hypothetical protein
MTILKYGINCDTQSSNELKADAFFAYKRLMMVVSRRNM